MAAFSIGFPQAVFVILLLIVVMSFAWLHLTVVSLMRQATPELAEQIDHGREPAAFT